MADWTLVWLLLTAGPSLVHEWDFRLGPGEWYAAHSAEVTAGDGVLRVRVTGDDPYLICSRGNCLDLAGRPGQFVRLRLRSESAGRAELFWADGEGDQVPGFAAAKRTGFALPGDGAWHEIDVYPHWRGRIRRLRFDPPSGHPGELSVERIAVYEWPESTQQGPHWSLRGDRGGWLPAGDTALEPTVEGLAIAGAQPAIAVDLAFDPPAACWLTWAARVSVPGEWEASWRDATDRRRSARRTVGAGAARLAVRLDAVGPSPTRGAVLTLAFTPADEVTAEAVIERIDLAPLPVGPPTLDLLAAAFDRAAAWAGEPVRLMARVQNSGGETLPAGAVPVALSVPLELRHGGLAPGEQADVSAPVPTERPGLVTGTVGEGSARRELLLAVSAPPAARPAAGASVTADTAALVGERLRLRAGRLGDGRHGPLRLELRDGQRWRAVASLDAVGWVDLTDSGRAHHVAGAARVIGDALAFTATGAGYSVTTRYRLAGPDRVAVETVLTATREVSLSLLAGPWLRVGDGEGGALREAVFPGVEYLGHDIPGPEASSSERDTDHPLNLRAVPDRHQITVPLMAVELPAGELVALLWRHDQHGDGPGAVFASPNFVESGALRSPRLPARSGGNHLMGLLLPAVPEAVRPNTLRAAEPVRLAAGQTLALTAQLLARRQGDVPDALRAWLECYRPAPAGDPAGLLPRTLRLSRIAFERVLWREGRGWVKHIARNDASLDPGVAVQYLYLARLLGEPELADLARSRVPAGGSLPWALHHGRVAETVPADPATLNSLPTPGPEEWVFRPDADHVVLGTPGETNVGIVADAAIGLLRRARAAANEERLRLGLLAVEQLARFRVPRGAQVWEVPLHCPDVLASARAVEALTLAYALTGERRFLAQADYWASTALPFVYHWQHPRPDLAPMRGGSIPVFGASAFSNAWFGRLVQWNGLELARALRELADLGGDRLWADLSRDLTVSAQRQQVSDENSDLAGLYPDYWNMRTGVPDYWMSPDRVLREALRQSGWTPDGQWLIANCDGKLIAIASPTPLLAPCAGQVKLGRIVRDLAAPCDLTFAVDYDLGTTSYVAMIGVDRPAGVTLAGTPAAEGDLSALSAGWSCYPDKALLVLKLDHAAGTRVAVKIAGLAPR